MSSASLSGEVGEGDESSCKEELNTDRGLLPEKDDKKTREQSDKKRIDFFNRHHLVSTLDSESLHKNSVRESPSKDDELVEYESSESEAGKPIPLFKRVQSIKQEPDMAPI